MTAHKEQHHILHNLKDHGCNGIDNHSIVLFFNDGMKTSKLDTMKTTIPSSANHRADFDGCVALCEDFIKQSEGTLELKVSVVGFADGIKEGAGKGKGDFRGRRAAR